MKGLELSKLYFHEVYMPMLQKNFPDLKAAAGLVGEGSECYGFDDEISRDHDWGAAVCLWLNQHDFQEMGDHLKREIERIPELYQGYAVRGDTGWSAGRTGVFEATRFYSKYIGYNYVPKTLGEWMRIPEINLSIVTNGEVFHDSLGEFTAFREGLLSFYPEDVRLKKIAGRCMQAAQSGQYNFPRSIKRKEYVAARLAESEFIDSAASLVFLLNRKYKPFYKWLHRAVGELPILGKETFQLLSELVWNDPFENTHYYRHKIDLVERISSKIIAELQDQGLSESNSDSFLLHGPFVQEKIKDEEIRALSLWQE